MKQRDRQLATLVIWGIFLILLVIITDRMLMVRADFLGIWPQPSGFPTAQDIEQINQTAQTALENSKTILPLVEQSIREQLAVRVPIGAILSLILIASATISTYFVWRNAGLEADLAYKLVNAEKAKRRSRIEQFMDELAPDELVELRTRLTTEESDEAQSLGDLMSDQQQKAK
ncbi:MAG: hypothetical protein K8L97_14855 [Anaerolineae bacterium]|nr:hypothetical protein [Anaerolineae bacterium]